MRRLNKRGFWMGEEAGKFILGVIAVVLLLTLAFKLAGIMQQNTKYQQAKYTMGEIEATITSLKEGETGTVFIESPKDWFLVAFAKEKGISNLPTTCGGESCLCLCPEIDKKNCETKGVCNNLKEVIVIDSEVEGWLPDGTRTKCKFSVTPLLLTLKKEGLTNLALFCGRGKWEESLQGQVDQLSVEIQDKEYSYRELIQDWLENKREIEEIEGPIKKELDLLLESYKTSKKPETLEGYYSIHFFDKKIQEYSIRSFTNEYTNLNMFLRWINWDKYSYGRKETINKNLNLEKGLKKVTLNFRIILK